MSQTQCLPVSGKNMSKVKKILEEARDLQTREIDLVERNLHSFDEIPSICEWRKRFKIMSKYGIIKIYLNAHMFTNIFLRWFFVILIDILSFQLVLVELAFVTRLTLSHNKISG